jgi:hypothetical protein
MEEERYGLEKTRMVWRKIATAGLRITVPKLIWL